MSIDTERAFDKIQHPFMLKTLSQQSGYRGNLFKLINIQYKLHS